MVRSKKYKKKGGDDVINKDNSPGVFDKFKNLFSKNDDNTSNSPGVFDKFKNMFAQKTYEADKGVNGAIGSAKDTGLSFFERLKQNISGASEKVDNAVSEKQVAGSKKRRKNLTKKHHKRKRI